MGYKMDICQVAALRIRKMRLEKNMTIDDLAEKCDVSTQTIKLIEAGRRNFKMDQRYCLGNINKDSLPHALFNENFINLVNFMTTGRFYMDDCNKCVLKYQCPRGCIGDCLANGSIHETDGGCFFRKENAIRQLLKQSEAIVAEHMQF